MPSPRVPPDRPPPGHSPGGRHRTVAGRPEPDPRQRSRLDGVDAARAVALAGMASVHILPVMTPAGAETAAGAIAAGRASALFAVLAGVGIALGTGGPAPVSGGRAHAAAAAGLVVRGVLWRSSGSGSSS